MRLSVFGEPGVDGGVLYELGIPAESSDFVEGTFFWREME